MSRLSPKNPSAPCPCSKWRNDLIFIVTLLLLVALIGAGVFFLREEGDTVVITVDGEPYGTYSLNEAQTVEIHTGETGENLNRLVIEAGKVWMETATCPDGLCSAHRPIYREGESIVCLPHRVVATVRKVQDSNDPDIIV